MKRVFDILVSLISLLLLIPFFIVTAILVCISSSGPVLYKQSRVGRNNKNFNILKFRTMFTGSDKGSLITIGGRDSRITRVGYFLRKYKLDELPQLINVLRGDMSMVGPRPEVRKYVELYNEVQLRVLSIRPGLTDYASIAYSNESDLLADVADPEKEYIENIMPAKLRLNLLYLERMSLTEDLKIIFRTLAKIMNVG